jgi:hypothetical protein
MLSLVPDRHRIINDFKEPHYAIPSQAGNDGPECLFVHVG